MYSIITTSFPVFVALTTFMSIATSTTTSTAKSTATPTATSTAASTSPSPLIGFENTPYYVNFTGPSPLLNDTWGVDVLNQSQKWEITIGGDDFAVLTECDQSQVIIPNGFDDGGQPTNLSLPAEGGFDVNQTLVLNLDATLYVLPNAGACSFLPINTVP